MQLFFFLVLMYNFQTKYLHFAKIESLLLDIHEAPYIVENFSFNQTECQHTEPSYFYFVFLFLSSVTTQRICFQLHFVLTDKYNINESNHNTSCAHVFSFVCSDFFFFFFCFTFRSGTTSDVKRVIIKILYTQKFPIINITPIQYLMTQNSFIHSFFVLFRFCSTFCHDTAVHSATFSVQLYFIFFFHSTNKYARDSVHLHAKAVTITA